MAKNLEPVVQPEQESTEDSSSSDDSVSKTTITTNVGSKKPLPESSSDSGEESSESEQDEAENAEPTNAVATKKPVSESSDESSESEVVKPQTQQQQTPPKKPVLDSSQSDEEEEEETSVVKPKLTPAKRSLPVPEEKETEILKTPNTKKAKKTEPTEKVKNSAAIVVSENSKKELFKKFWTDEDLIVILKGLLEYPDEVNAANVDAFLSLIKKDLHSLEVTKGQLYDKIRRLKKKFENNKVKKVRNFANPHEKEVYELSLKLWGNSDDIVVVAGNGNAVKGKGKIVKANGSGDNEAGAVEGGKVKVAAGIRFGSVGWNVEKLLSIGVDMFDGEQEVKGFKEWKKLEREEMLIAYKHVKVVQAKMKLVLDNME